MKGGKQSQHLVLLTLTGLFDSDMRIVAGTPVEPLVQKVRNQTIVYLNRWKKLTIYPQISGNIIRFSYSYRYSYALCPKFVFIEARGQNNFFSEEPKTFPSFAPGTERQNSHLCFDFDWSLTKRFWANFLFHKTALVIVSFLTN